MQEPTPSGRTPYRERRRIVDALSAAAGRAPMYQTAF